MEKLDKKVCLDTDVIIAILNGEERASKLIENIENNEIFISSINLFELLLRENNLEPIEEFRNKVKLFNFDELAARKASMIFKDLKTKGSLIDFRDIFIASSCITNNCQLATFNKKHFEKIKEIKIIN